MSFVVSNLCTLRIIILYLYQSIKYIAIKYKLVDCQDKNSYRWLWLFNEIESVLYVEMKMVSSNLFDTLYKTLNFSEQQYKETEEIVENNPRIFLFVKDPEKCITNFPSSHNTNELCDNSDFVAFRNDNVTEIDKVRASYSNGGFEHDFMKTSSDYLR
jgi:hypothetical protein